MSWEVEHIGPHTLYRGDCREVVPTLGTVDALVTDPPYGVSLQGKRGHYRHAPQAQRHDTYASYDDTPENFSAIVVPVLRSMIPHVLAAAIFMASRHLAALPPPDDIGGFFLPNGCGCGRWGFQTFMHVAFYGSDPYLRTGQGCRPNGRYGLYGNDANSIDHPCAKPLAAMTWIIDRVSLPGAQIIDPFAGSATSGVAAIMLGRIFTGIEIERQYFDIACQRMHDAMAQPDLFVPTSSPVQLHLFGGAARCPAAAPPACTSR